MKEEGIDSELLYRFFDGSSTDDENIYIRKWIEASSQNREYFFRERKLFDALILLHEEPDEIPYDNILPDDTVKTGRRTVFGTFMKVAAAVVILLMSGILFVQIKNTKYEGLGMQAINVPAGQYVHLALPDGTQIWLNARTKIEYPVLFNKNQRVVKLDGQAYFEVAHDEDAPFVVETSKGNVSVLGTKFDVMAYSGEDGFETTLMDGKVDVSLASDPDQSLTLSPDTRAYLKDGKLKAGRIDDYDIYRWKEGLICFNNASFEDIMRDFEKIYGAKINIENGRIGKYLYTGKFRFVDGIDYALRVLQKEIKFGYERNPDNHIINIK
jgi:ferric-dicitrate binding protein FerR (iron transport regulator)